MIRRLFYIIFFLTLGLPVDGQLIPLLDQYRTNGLVINPAYAGSQDALQLELYSRRQWVGFEGAPSTITFSMHGPLGKRKVNLGVIVMSDKYGSNKETGFLLNYAYRIYLGKGDFSLGLAAGMTGLSSDMDAFRFIQTGDVLLQDPARKAYLPEFSIGGYYQTDRFFIGLSMPLFLSHSMSASGGDYNLEFKLSSANYILTAGYLVRLSEDFELLPSLLIKSNPVNSTQVDLNCNVIFRERIWLGSSIRTNGNLSTILLLQINPQIRMGYSYGYEISELSTFQKGSHEVTLTYLFNYLLEVISPRYF